VRQAISRRCRGSSPEVISRSDGLHSVFSTKTTQQPIVYDHIISYHLLRRLYTNGYDLYCNINTETHTQTNRYLQRICKHAPIFFRVIVWLGQYPKFDLYVLTPEFAFTQRRIRTTVYRLSFAVKLLLTINYI